MASSYSSRLRLELPATGEQSGTWGQTMNAFMGTFLEDAICGFSYCNVTAGDYTLSVSIPGGTADEARRAILIVTGTPAAATNVIIPPVQKNYTVINQTGQIVVIKTAAGPGVGINPGATQIILCDSFSTFGVSIPYSPGTINLNSLALTGSLAVGGFSVFGITAGASTPVTVLSSNAAFAIDVRGRALDSVGIIRFLDAPGTTEQARFQAGPGPNIALYVGPTLQTVFSTDAAGNFYVPHALSVGAGATVSGGLTVVTGGLVIAAGDLVVRTAGNAGIGAVFLGNSGGRYLQWDGANYIFGGSGIAYHTGNFNPGAYLPLGGGNISGSLSVAGQTQIVGPLYSDSGNTYLRNSGSGNINLYFYQTSGAERGVIWADGNDNAMRCRASQGGGNWVLEPNGNFSVSNNVYANSDIRLKRAFAPLPVRRADAIVRGLAKAVSYYQWIDPAAPGNQLGVIAQEVQPILPEAVSVATDGTLRVADRPIIAALIASLASALDRIAALEAAHG